MMISTGETLITTSDIDDLAGRVRLGAGDTRELEAAKDTLFAGGLTPAEAQRIRQRLMVTALRHGGDLLAKVLGRLTPRETAMVRRYAHRLANYLDTLDLWAAQPVMLALMRFGIPYDEAESIAVAVLFQVW
ncbi:hypothetical protein [Streptomyces sp. NBRC 110028]|uniref:hypothetical protein n=1 Tax=Streptomyces sp. NBRC 110028 TaxID=1621260 RepID=UPI0006E2B357|nr:hypothetical protein [Streptomyces sp. NBRC 110028]